MHAALDESGIDLLKNLLSIDFDKRFKTEEILKHSFLADFHVENESEKERHLDFIFELEVQTYKKC